LFTFGGASGGHLCDSTAFLFFQSVDTQTHKVTDATGHRTHDASAAAGGVVTGLFCIDWDVKP